jgi:hypothetical protein
MRYLVGAPQLVVIPSPQAGHRPLLRLPPLDDKYPHQRTPIRQGGPSLDHHVGLFSTSIHNRSRRGL